MMLARQEKLLTLEYAQCSSQVMHAALFLVSYFYCLSSHFPTYVLVTGF